MNVVTLPYPKESFNVPELVMGEYKEMRPMSPLLPSFAEYLIEGIGPPEVVIMYVDMRDGEENAHVAEEYCVRVFMPPLKSQACVVQVCRQEPVEEGGTEHYHDYYQVPYDEVPTRIDYHMRCGNADGDLLPFVAEVNNAQFRDSFHENDIEAWSRYHYSKAEDTETSDVPVWTPSWN